MYRRGRGGRKCESWFENTNTPLCRSKWSVGVDQIAAGCGESGHPHLLGMLQDFKHWCLSLTFPILMLERDYCLLAGTFDKMM